MRSGKMDRRITVEKRTVTIGTDGGEIITWNKAYEKWAERETQSATERFITSERIADVNTLFRLRWDEEASRLITPQDYRLVYRDRWYEILAVVEIGRREGMWIGCASRGDVGGVP